MGRKTADNYNHQADWQKMFLRTTTWKTDLLFYKQDLRFVQLVLNRYFGTGSDIKKVTIEPDKEINIEHLHRYCNTLIQETNYHIKELAVLIKDPFKHRYTDFQRENKYLKDDIANFAKTLRRLRKDVFHITEAVLENKQLFSSPQLKNVSLNHIQVGASA